MKKKIITMLTISTLLIFGTVSNALAAGTGEKQVFPAKDKEDAKGSVLINAEVDASYMVSIPTEVDFSKIKKAPQGATGSDAYVESGIQVKLNECTGFRRVTVGVATDNDFYLKGIDPISDDNKIKYSLVDSSNNAVSGSNIGTLDLSDSGKIKDYKIRLDTTDVKYVGKYSGTLNFIFDAEEKID
ncbi:MULTISPECIES: hypothetical protein [Clostridium]|uniref:Uncharacterized protein n=1 Tax=Clostridium cibarium TaxID=2762247 RepID=A0ABR8PW34_9CLOT|nr:MULTISPECIES: hypothetical protein [Clostridium]MBD7912360.1 hypothetical protein [Clostridium cibarium]